MKCKKIKKLISKYFDNQPLSQQEQQMMNSHISYCQNCKKEFELLQKIYTFLPEYEKVQISDKFNSKLLSLIQNEKKIETNLEYILSGLKKMFIPVAVMLVVVFNIITFVRPCRNLLIKEYYFYELYPEEDSDIVLLEFVEFLQSSYQGL